jgi:hypothetical protein
MPICGPAGRALKGAPFSQRRSACQWMAATTPNVISGMAKKSFSSLASVSSRRSALRDAGWARYRR